MIWKWTHHKLVVEARKYGTRIEFQRGSPGAYQTARKRGLLDEICKHMIPAPRGRPKHLCYAKVHGKSSILDP